MKPVEMETAQNRTSTPCIRDVRFCAEESTQSGPNDKVSRKLPLHIVPELHKLHTIPGEKGDCWDCLLLHLNVCASNSLSHEHICQLVLVMQLG